MSRATQLTLTLNAEYVTYGPWECLRELLQNGQDAHDIGFPLNVAWREANPADDKRAICYTENASGERVKGGVLRIENEGTKLDRRTLVLGGTSKRDDERQRGQWGEGMKLALVNLLRMKYAVRIDAGDEFWTPVLEANEDFDGEVLLTVKTRKKRIPDNRVVVEITGITEDDWNMARSRLMFLSEPEVEEFLLCDSGRILTSDRFVGKLFCRGIYVCDLPPEFRRFGYDLNGVKLDRDRQMADPWSLKWEVKRALKSSVHRSTLPVETAVELLEDDSSGEARVFDDVQYDSAAEPFFERVAKHFEACHGENAVPVTSYGEAVEAGHHSMKGVQTSKALARVVGKTRGTLDERKVKSERDIAKRFGPDDLEESERATLEWAVGLICCVVPSMTLDQVSVVEFFGDDLKATFDPETGNVQIARSELADKALAMRGLVHEIAHTCGGDGTATHRDACDMILSSIIVEFLGELA